MTKIKVGFVDDQRLFRNGFARILQTFKKVDVTIVAESGQDLFKHIEVIGPPDVVLIDLDMPDLDGTKVAKLLKAQYPEIRSIILTGHDNNELIVRLLQDGFRAYLHKDANENEVEEAIYEVYRKGKFSSSRALEAMHSYPVLNSSGKHNAAKGEGLTASEIEIIKLICKGLKDAEIADKLNKGIRTIQNQRLILRKKIDAHSTAEVISYAIKHKLIEGSEYLKIKRSFDF